MNVLAQRYLELTPEQQRRVHVRLCERALEVWDAYAALEGEITHRDSVVGMRHTADAGLPALALAAAAIRDAGRKITNWSRHPRAPTIP